MNDEDIRANDLFWQRADELRVLRGLSERELSEACFMSSGSFTEGKKNKSAPGVDFVDGMARILNVSAEYLVTGFGDIEQPYIPAEVPIPNNPNGIVHEAERVARATHVRQAAISLVLSQNPDPRLGIARILELFWRAEKRHRKIEEHGEGKKKKKRKASS